VVTGFLSLELASRRHRVTGVDFAPLLIAEARRKSGERGATIRYEEADAEQQPFAAASFDLVVSRHLVWTFAAPSSGHGRVGSRAPAGRRLIVVESEADATASPEPLDEAWRSPEYAAIVDRLPYASDWPREETEKLFAAHRLLNIGRDPFSICRCRRAADGRGRARTAHPPALRRLGRQTALALCRTDRRDGPMPMALRLEWRSHRQVRRGEKPTASSG